MKVPTMSGFVGFNGDAVLLDPNGYPDNHPLVLARPDLFVDAPSQKRGRVKSAPAEPTRVEKPAAPATPTPPASTPPAAVKPAAEKPAKPSG